jgi:predicted acyl esterase
MDKNMNRNSWKSKISYGFVMLLFASLALLPVVSLAINHPTSNPYEVRPSPDGSLAYRIIPTPGGLVIEKDIMVAMPDGIKLACNVFRPEKPGKFPVIMVVTPYGKTRLHPLSSPTAPIPSSYFPYVFRVYSHGAISAI